MALKAFFDESGKDQPPVFVMAGFVARAEQWAAFNEEWQFVLQADPAIEAFHMTDARWSGHDSKLPRLLDVIRRHVITGLAVLVNHEEYRRAMKGQIGKNFDRPYAMTLFSTMAVTAFWQDQAGIDEPVDFIYDEQNGESDFIQFAWSKAFRSMPDDIRRRIGGRPIHVSDLTHPPLQAADILAWYLRRRRAAEMLAQPRDTEMARLFAGIKVAVWPDTAGNFRKIVEGVHAKLQSEGMLTEHQFNALVPHRDKIIQLANKFLLANAAEGDIISLQTFPAKQMRRFRLVHKCEYCDIPHLHRRVEDDCLGASLSGPESE